MASEQLIGIGIVVILIGFALIIIGSLLTATKGKTKSDFAVIGFIGPIPFGIASDRNLLYLAIAVSLILLFVFLFLSRKIFI